MKLCGTGWLPWSEIVRLAGGWQATWTDLDGAHLAPFPSSAPEATHIWAWSGECWIRFRVDEGEAVAGLLHPDGACPRGAADCAEVPVSSVRRAETWLENHVNVGVLRGMEWDLIETLDRVATTFVRAAAK